VGLSEDFEEGISAFGVISPAIEKALDSNRDSETLKPGPQLAFDFHCGLFRR
jgi:hypothetical protein